MITIESSLLGDRAIPIVEPTRIRLPEETFPAEEKTGTTEVGLTATPSLMVDVSGFSLGALDSYVEAHGDAALAPCIGALMCQVDNPVRSIGGHNS